MLFVGKVNRAQTQGSTDSTKQLLENPPVNTGATEHLCLWKSGFFHD